LFAVVHSTSNNLVQRTILTQHQPAATFASSPTPLSMLFPYLPCPPGCLPDTPTCEIDVDYRLATTSNPCNPILLSATHENVGLPACLMIYC